MRLRSFSAASGPKPNTAEAFVMSADRGRPDAGPRSPLPPLVTQLRNRWPVDVTKREANISVMIGPFPFLQVVGGLIGGFGGFAVGYQLFSRRKPNLGWHAHQLRNLGALAIMAIGMTLGQISGYLLHALLA
jgi:hypothetical protein